MIIANDSLILHILQMCDGAIREEVLMNVMALQPTEREAASQQRGTD
jgi:hypothetical protein